MRKSGAFCDTVGMSRARKYRPFLAHSGPLPDDLCAYADAPDVSREPDLPNRIVTDDWPDPVPVTDAEVTVFEAWFEQELDALLREDDADCYDPSLSLHKTNNFAPKLKPLPFARCCCVRCKNRAVRNNSPTTLPLPWPHPLLHFQRLK